MAEESLEQLTADQLMKRKRFFFLIFGILIGLVIVNVVAGVLTGTPALFASLALLAVGLPLFAMIKRINAEISKRENA